MKKMILVTCHLSLVTLSSLVTFIARADTQCAQVERMLNEELSRQPGFAPTIEEHVRTARIYRAMANRGCPGNAETYKEYSRASLDAARSLVYIDGYKGAEKARYDNMIKQATGF